MGRRSQQAGKRQDVTSVPPPSPPAAIQPAVGHVAAPGLAHPRLTRNWWLALLLVGLLGLIVVGVGAGWYLFGRPVPPDLEGMVWLPGGAFTMGDSFFADAPPHRVSVDGFWIDRTEVTNAQFARFVEATSYKTVAERPPDPAQFPDATNLPKEPFSIVFTPPSEAVPLNAPDAWWSIVPGACWKHPEGPRSSIESREDHPVVHICFEDAQAYCTWARKRLPTEAEWEYAARGGLDQTPYVWGDAKPGTGGKWQANIWQGAFPHENTAEDGYPRTSPVGSFPANGYGLVDMSGNVWEWCGDWYHPRTYREGPTHNPTGPPSSYDPQEPGLPKRVQRGGSFLCCDTYCVRYRPGGRGKGDIYSAASHIGFRCVWSPSR